MAKEMMIVFVYDTQLLQREEDDPASAILYFHPGWVSDQQRTSLCGQIIGTSHFLSSVFKGPRIYSLQSGKFAIRTYGRYLLAVGTDRNIANWVLQHRADTLTSLISFYHCDFNKLSSMYQESTNLSAKLYFMFETYLKVLMYGGHMFYNIPTIQLPKSASHVFLETIQFLQWCQQLNYVLGGTVLYHNKVVATQLTSDLTKQIVLTDPYRIKCPAESVSLDFVAPLGIQLLHVYISKKEYTNLLEDAAMSISPLQYQKCSSRKPSLKSREPILSAMKRDQSIIFTTVPEEDVDDQIPHVNTKSSDRPTSLNLNNKLSELDNIPKSQAVPFVSQTSICSTPMSDLNKLVHQNIMSICVNPEEIELKENLDNLTSNLEKKHFKLTSWGKENDSWVVIDDIPPPFSKRNCLTRHFSGIINSTNEDEVPKRLINRLRSVADPFYPFFKANGYAVSHWLFNKYISEPVNFLECRQPYQQPLSPINNIKTEIIKVTTPITSTPPPRKPRKPLSLPLKSLSSEQPIEVLTRNTGVQLTPLMAKLSFLPSDDGTKSSGFCTPSDCRDGRFTSSQSNYSFLERMNSIPDDSKDCNDLVEVILLVCGQQDMVVALLLENGVCTCPEIINQLWEKSTESLGKLQRQLRHSLETYQGSSQNGTAEPYSYLCMDPQWDTVQRGGPWGGSDLGVLTHLHRDFLTGNLTEIILRNEESLVYGHHCGGTEVFYQQAITSTAGLPTPADLMGTVTLKAKRRLERDHSIILL